MAGARTGSLTRADSLRSRVGCAEGAIAASNDVIGGLDEAGGGRQWYHLIGGDLPLSCPRHAFICGVPLVSGDFGLSLSAHRDLARGRSQRSASCCDISRVRWATSRVETMFRCRSGRPEQRFRLAWPNLSVWTRSQLPSHPPRWRRG